MTFPFRLLLVATVVLSFTAPPGRAADSPVKIIFDSDVDHDCDDIAALFMLHGAVQRGQVELLATIGCTSTDEIAPCLDAINIWFGRPTIPVAMLKDKGFMDHKGFAAQIAKQYPCKHISGNDYPDAVATYRRILMNQSDASVVVLAVGPLRNIANLLQSQPDEISPLDGIALVAKKVKRLDIMGGIYPPQGNLKEGEWNFKQDPASAALVCSTWPTPILFNGEGGSTNSGRRVTFEMPEHNPLTMAFRHSADVGFAGDRLSWDPISTLVAVRGPTPWFEVVKGGTNVVDPKTGINTWNAGADRGHAYLVMKASKSQIETSLEDLQTAGRGRPTKLKFNTTYYANAGMCRITARGEAEPSMAAVKAFDSNERSVWLDQAKLSWIQCQYIDGRRYCANSYTVVCPDRERLPASLKLSGSNDGTNWTELDVQEAPVFSERISRQEFALANAAKWNRYRLDVTSINEQEGVRIATIELNAVINCQPEVAVASVTLDVAELSLSANSRRTVNATLAPLNSFEREVAWASSDPTVAEVRKIGEHVVMVVGKKPGKCTLTATVGEVNQTCPVTVTPTTLPDGWDFDELNTPAIPGSIDVSDGKFTLMGCGHAMTSWWERVRDQGVFVSRPATGDVELTARLVSLSGNVGGPNAYHTDSRPPTASGLMIRESLDEKCGRYLLIQVEATGNLVCRWRDKTGDQDDNQSKSLGKIAVPSHLRLVRSGMIIKVFASTDGKDWGQPLMSHPAKFSAGSRIGLFVCSGNTFAAAKAVYDSVTANLAPANGNVRTEMPVISFPAAQDAIDLGGRRELFVDNLLVQELRGDARRVFHHPIAREVVMTFDQPWEGNTTIPTAIFQDGDMYRMYYRASNTPGSAGGEKRGAHEFDCYAESRDGVHWTRPQLRQLEFQNSKDNNIIHAPDVPDGWSLGALNPFQDYNPRAEPDALFKAVTPLYGPGTNPDDWLSKEKGLAVLKSPDGIRWSLARQDGVFRNEGLFDSVNVAFWDTHRQEYRAYFRNAEAPAWFRDIKTGTSRDFTQWIQAVPLTYSTKPPAQFYTNGIRNYHRAPHLLVGFPGMYDDREWSSAMAQLPDTEKRRTNIEAWHRSGPLSEVHLMWSRDGTKFELSPSAFMRPGPERSGSWTYSDNVAWHLVETASNLEGAPPELTLYANEFYYLGDVRLRRYTMRLDGFASIHASNDGGELLTQPIVFQGNQLSLNFATSAFGSLRVEIQDQSGQPLPGFALADSVELYGDTVARAALWKGEPDLGSLAGKRIRLRFVLRDSNLYSMQFESNK